MSSIKELAVGYCHPKSLTPNPGNARTHSKAQIRKIADSVRAFGFTNPILVDTSGMIIAGHGRVEAAKLLDLDQVPTIQLDRLSPAQIRAYVLADNKLALAAGWDENILRIEFQNLIVSDDVEIALTGFETAEVDLIIGTKSAKDELDDDLHNVIGPPVTQAGDIWQLGEHRILCGDVRTESGLASLLNGRKADVGFQDPPYNLVIQGNVSGKGLVKHRNFAMGVGEMSGEEFTQFLVESLGNLARHSENGSVHFVCIDWRGVGRLLAAGEQVYDTVLNLCTWVKDNGGQGSFYRSRHELIFVFRNGKGPHRNNIQLGKYGRYRTNVWEYPAVRGLPQQQGEEGNLLALHPTVKPVALIADAILDCSARGELVLDGFLGSGSTLIAAERVGRVCYGVELDPLYVDVAIRRWQRYTGDRAVNSASGHNFDDLAQKGVSHG